VDDYLDETGRGPSAITSPYGCFLEHPGLFDHKMFSVSPREAMQMDPGQRLLMHAVYEALEDAGVCNNGSVATDSRRIGTYIGDGSDDWRELQQQHGVDKYVLGGTQRSFTPGRLNHHFNWEGATFCVDSACGSTASAVGLAYRALISRDCDTAVAGGSNIIATPFWQSVLSKGGFLSTTGGCKTFRSDADGYCRGEAVGVVVLKRLEDALQDNDNIMSVICSYARNHSAETVSITRPHVATQERVYRSALHKAGLAPDDISYVEMHGTGTTAGDSAELESVVNVLAQKESRDTPLMVGAIKANLGHAEAASGISSIMKAAVMFRKGMVPPQVGIPHKLGDYACLKQGSILIPGEAVPYTRQSVGRKRRMMVNNFDAAVCVLLGLFFRASANLCCHSREGTAPSF
jgi:acyl transferase domain-containing protein